MSAATDAFEAEDRLLTFEVGGDFYAIPISGVLEVAEADRLTCIPTLPKHTGGVINYHGDALPVLNCSAVLDVAESELVGHGTVLVISGSGESARLGLPVDRVLGLVEGAPASMPSAKAVAERRSIQGRVASVLDPQRLVAQARDVIEGSLGRRN